MGEANPSTATSNNVEIFDKAVSLIKSTELQSKVLPSGETMSYREFNAGQSHVLVMLPGYVSNDTHFSTIAVLPEFADHHIIAVNPVGWNKSTMNKPISSHEENAHQVVSLLKMMGIKKAMVGGYSTGGGIAYHMAHRYPNMFDVAFLLHSIPIDGFRSFDDNGNPVKPKDAAAGMSTLVPDDMNCEAFCESLKAFSSKPEGLPAPEHSITKYLVEGVQMPGKIEAIVNNMNFNVTPVKTPYAEPSNALSSLKSKIVVIHGSQDVLVDAEQVELVTKLAIKENWAPPGKLSFYDDGEGHLTILDNPIVLASAYRRAFEEQVVTAVSDSEADTSAKTASHEASPVEDVNVSSQ